jgi:hypothetical protein
LRAGGRTIAAGSAGPAVVRHLVAEPTWQAVRRSPTVRAYFERVRRDDPQRNLFP